MGDSDLGETLDDNDDDSDEDAMVKAVREDLDPDVFVPDEVEEEEEEEEEEEQEMLEDAAHEELDSDEPQEEDVVPGANSITEVDHHGDANRDGADSVEHAKKKHRKQSDAREVAPRFKREKLKGSQLSFTAGPGLKVRSKGVEKVHARGTLQFGKGGGLENRLKDLFGPTHDDLMPIIRTRDWWDHQETLPSRADGSLRRSFHVPEGVREREIKNLQEWYSTVGKAAFSDGQKTSVLEKEKGETYMVTPGPTSLNLLLGEYNDPSLYKLKKGSYISTAAPFSTKKDRRGWVLNLGSRIQEAQWAANEEGSTQYLAVAVSQVETIRPKHKPLENPKAPGFSTTPQFPASIQIWAFESLRGGDMDPVTPPRLELVICTDWGALKHFRWCPLAATDSVEASDAGEMIHLPLLAGFWSDGRVRVLDISYPKPDPNSFETQYVHYTQAAFDVGLPQTIPTCLHWLSATSITVTSSIGTLAIWTLTRPGTLRAPGVERHNPRPWFYKQVADTYIPSICSGYPSRPNILSITTADGYSKLFDLRSPLLDICIGTRGRNLVLEQIWHEHTQSFILADDNYMLRSNTIRRYYTNLYNMRSESSVVCCASSPVHPGILLGGADGTVQAGNPIAKLLNEKEIPWQQIWFKHEWRPSVDKLTLKVAGQTGDEEEEDQIMTDAGQPSTSNATTNDETVTGDAPPATTSASTPASSSGSHPHTPNPQRKVTPEVLAQPLARITEGFKVQRVNLGQSKPYNSATAGGKYVTIFEEPSAVTTVAWNPNLKFGTWAVAGMGDGLLRVEDLNV
jgi:transcription factor C subunit 6